MQYSAISASYPEQLPLSMCYMCYLLLELCSMSRFNEVLYLGA